MDIKIKYFSSDYPKLEKISKGDWIDLRVDNFIGGKSNIMDRWFNSKEVNIINKYLKEDVLSYSEGDILFVGLGVAMELPKNHEAYVVPRSSTFKNTGLILTNNVGIIDSSYCGDDDEWRAMLYATRDGVINRHDRLLQFRIQEKMPELNFIEVDKLEGKSRGGYGTTGLR